MLITLTKLSYRPIRRARLVMGLLTAPLVDLPRSPIPVYTQFAQYLRWFRPPLRKKWRVPCRSGPCDQDCWHTGVGWRHWLLIWAGHPADIGCMLAELVLTLDSSKVLKGMSCLATDCIFYAEIIILFLFVFKTLVKIFCCWQCLWLHFKALLLPCTLLVVCHDNFILSSMCPYPCHTHSRVALGLNPRSPIQSRT